jgi:diguanylate cyclase (GGDEF)-like protein
VELALILLFGCILLGIGSGALFLARWSNPYLKGLGWLGAAFAVGCTGALLLFLVPHPRVIVAFFSDSFMLLAFTLLHGAFLASIGAPGNRMRFGLTLQAVLVLCFTVMLLRGIHFRVECISTLIALQTLHTLITILRNMRKGIRLPLWFCSVILTFFSLLNFFRGALYFFLFPLGISVRQFEGVVYIIYTSTAIGLAFGIFWLTTAQLTSRLEHMASTDPLTRIYNRRVFLEWCDREVLRSSRGNHSFSILLVDLDHFKQVNDRFGHAAGDAALCAVVEEMQNAVRGIDILGRWGGEEFVILLPGADSDAALRVAERVRDNVTRIKLPELQALDNQSSGVTVSIGIASYRGVQEAVTDLLNRADSALYAAKSQGRNCAVIHV